MLHSAGGAHLHAGKHAQGPLGLLERLASSSVSGWKLRKLSGTAEVVGTPLHFDLHRDIKVGWLVEFVLQALPMAYVRGGASRLAVRVRLSRAGEQAVFELPPAPGHTLVYVQEDVPLLLSMLPHSEQEMEDQLLLRIVEGRLLPLPMDRQVSVLQTSLGASGVDCPLHAFIGSAEACALDCRHADHQRDYDLACAEVSEGAQLSCL